MKKNLRVAMIAALSACCLAGCVNAANETVAATTAATEAATVAETTTAAETTVAETTSAEIEKKENRKDKKKKPVAQKPSREEVELLAAAREFLVENLKKGFENGVEYRLHALNGKAYLGRDVALPPYGVFASGVCVGEMNGKRFLPHHQLFSAFGTEFLRRVELASSDGETEAYLKGMEIAVGDKLRSEGKAEGWAAVLVDGCALGGGKVSLGVCKNHYPKGLRNQ